MGGVWGGIGRISGCNDTETREKMSRLLPSKKARQSAEPSPSIHFTADVTSVPRAWSRLCFPGSAEASQVWSDPARQQASEHRQRRLVNSTLNYPLKHT